MGGYGSTRWRWYARKNTVEASLTLSVFALKQEGILRPDHRSAGSWQWTSKLTKELLATIGYEVDTRSEPAWLKLLYTVTPYQGEKRDYEYKIRLVTTPCNFGGVRWWFICPLVLDGRRCGRRVAKLYKPSNSVYFGCRHCHDLTYRSAQESSKRLRRLKKLDPWELLAGMKDGSIDAIDALMVLPDELWRR